MTTDLSRHRLQRALPWLWLAMSMLWAVVILVTDALAWPLAIWIATTLGPLTYIGNSKTQAGRFGPDGKGGHE